MSDTAGNQATTMTHKVSIKMITALRKESGASLGDIRKALDTAASTCPAPMGGGPSCHCEEKAKELLKARGVELSKKRQGRLTEQGRIQTYVHHDARLGVLVEVNCETDFVARTEDFQQFCRDLALHVAAMNPRFITKDDPRAQGLDADQVKAECLLEQAFVKDPSTTVGGLLQGLIAKTGENCVIRRFVRFAVGEATDQVS